MWYTLVMYYVCETSPFLNKFTCILHRKDTNPRKKVFQSKTYPYSFNFVSQKMTVTKNNLLYQYVYFSITYFI